MNPALRRAVRQLVPTPLANRLSMLAAVLRARWVSARTRPERRIPNPLAKPLVVSLTSFPPRFPTLHRTLDSLLRQSVAPDAVVLWIAQPELPLLPPAVLALKSRGLTICGCPDIGSYKKLIFALQEYPDAFIATADDDMFYVPGWLQGMVEAVDPSEKVIVCHRAHRIAIDENGRIAPYASSASGFL